uniref:Uncharacterized protein n=1 Tax=Bactrocera latifrons TaxID=174628 RepID=A0A0K8TYT9_BACLA
MQYSKSDYEVFNSSFVSSNDFFSYPNNNNNKSQHDGPHQFQTQVQIHSQSVDNIRNMQIASDSDTELHEKASTTTLRSFQGGNVNNNTLRFQPTLAPTTTQFQPFADFSNAIKPDFPSANSNFNTNNSNNNNNPLSNYAFGQPPAGSANDKYPAASLTSSYSNALTAALADTPGIKIAPLSMLPTSATTMQTTFDYAAGFGNSFDNNSVAGGAGGGSLFNYGFFDANSSMNHNHNNNFGNNIDNNNAIFSTSTLSSSSLGNCKLEVSVH